MVRVNGTNDAMNGKWHGVNETNDEECVRGGTKQ